MSMLTDSGSPKTVDTIFTFTVFCIKDGAISSKHTWGWATSFEEAERYVTHPDDMFYDRGSYNYAVIEECKPGYYGGVVQSWWYQASDFALSAGNIGLPGKVERIDRLPLSADGFAGCCCFAMG